MGSYRERITIPFFRELLEQAALWLSVSISFSYDDAFSLFPDASQSSCVLPWDPFSFLLYIYGFTIKLISAHGTTLAKAGGGFRSSLKIRSV